MGYIYLKPTINDLFDEYELSKSEITGQVAPEKLKIPYYTDLKIAEHLDNMTMEENIFKVDHNLKYETEYGNDMDEEGYISGIELSLSSQEFTKLIEENAYRVIETKWRAKEFRVITLDHMVKVMDPRNIIYKLTDREDAFVVVELKNQSYNSSSSKLPIILFKALISAREDIYPIDYLLNPEFILSPNDSYKKSDDLQMTLSDKLIWDTLTSSERQQIQHCMFCEKCGRNIKNLDCTINMVSSETLLARLYCYKCEQHSVKKVTWNSLNR